MDILDWPFKEGSYKALFLDGKIRRMEVKRAIHTSSGSIMYFEDVEGKIWSFDKIIWFAEAEPLNKGDN